MFHCLQSASLLMDWGESRSDLSRSNTAAVLLPFAIQNHESLLNVGSRHGSPW